MITSGTRLCAVAFALMLFCSCGAGHMPADLPSAETPTLETALPALAQLDKLRRASEPFDSAQNGADSFRSSDGAADDGTTAVLDASASGPGAGEDYEWALYAFLLIDLVPIELSVDLQNLAGTGGYIALPDYDSGRWSLHGPFAAGQSFDVSDESFVSPSGFFYCAVISSYGDSTRVNTVTLTVDSGFPNLPQTLDSTGTTGYDSCMEIVNGNPAIAYTDFGTLQLRYIRALDATGSAWGEPMDIPIGEEEARFPSMKIINGNPCIAYFENSNETLRYVRAVDNVGGSWHASQSIDAQDICGEFCSLTVVDGFPAVSYQSYGAETLRYVRALDADGIAWGEPLDIDSIGSAEDSAEGTSMLVSAGNPAIAYYSYSGELRFIRATDATGSAWPENPLMLDSNDDAGRFASMALVSGTPAISYQRGDTGSLHFIRATFGDGSAWQDSVPLDSGGDTGLTTSLAVIDNVPAVAYYDIGAGDLRYVEAVDTTGLLWEQPVTLAEEGDVGAHCSLIELPIAGGGLSYLDVSLGDLLFFTPQL